MIHELSASKVAGFIGLNKYQDAKEIFYDLLSKNKDVREKIATIEQTHGRKPFNSVINEILKDQPIQDCISSGIKESQKTSDVSNVLQEVEEQARLILDLRRDCFTPEIRDLLASEIRGQVAKQRGLRNENAILNQYETSRDVKVTERNTKMIRKDYGSFKLIGRTDGYVASENRIVDSKERTRAWPTVPLYDEIQLRCYMDMTGATEAELIERFPDGTTRHTKFLNDSEKWKSIQSAIERNIEKINLAISNPEELKRIVFTNTICMKQNGDTNKTRRSSRVAIQTPSANI